MRYKESKNIECTFNEHITLTCATDSTWSGSKMCKRALSNPYAIVQHLAASCV